MSKKQETFPSNPLDQYRRLLKDYADAIAAHTARAISAVRAAAADKLLADDSLRLPTKGQEGYEYTDLAAMFAPDMGVNIMRLPVTTDVEAAFRCGVPALSSLLGITVNDTFRPTDQLLRLLPEGVTVTAFSKADDNAAAVIARHYGKCDDADAAVTLNTALAQDGLLVHVAKGVHLDKPIQLVGILQPGTAPDGTEMPVLAVRRLLVVLEDDASASIMVCDHDKAGDSESASTRVTEVVLGNNSALRLYELEETSGSASRHTQTVVHQGADSRLTVFSGTLKPGTTRNNFTVHLDGPGACLQLDGMAILDGNRTADNSATVLHHAPHCTSNQTFKYLVADNARGAFEGLIRVDHGAVATEAFQNDRNLIASPGARMHARPQLEIYCDDVKCSHGAATGQLDDRALFYMRARGIDLPEARSMLMNAFMADVIDAVDLVPLRDRLKHLVELRLSGDDARCQGCNVC